MNQRISLDAFGYYVGLNATRSDQAVADRFGVTNTAVVNRASEEIRQAKLREVERCVADAAAKKADESIVATNDRHLKSLRVIQGKALEALETLRSMASHSAMDPVRALDVTIKEERVIQGEPPERTAVVAEDAIKREYERWVGAPAGKAASDETLIGETVDVGWPSFENALQFTTGESPIPSRHDKRFRWTIPCASVPVPNCPAHAWRLRTTTRPSRKSRRWGICQFQRPLHSASSSCEPTNSVQRPRPLP